MAVDVAAAHENGVLPDRVSAGMPAAAVTPSCFPARGRSAAAAVAAAVAAVSGGVGVGQEGEVATGPGTATFLAMLARPVELSVDEGDGVVGVWREAPHPIVDKRGQRDVAGLLGSGVFRVLWRRRNPCQRCDRQRKGWMGGRWWAVMEVGFRRGWGGGQAGV